MECDLVRRSTEESTGCMIYSTRVPAHHSSNHSSAPASLALRTPYAFAVAL